MSARESHWRAALDELEKESDILSSFELRTITLGENLLDTIDADLETMKDAISRRLRHDLPLFGQAVREVIRELSHSHRPPKLQKLLQTIRVTVTPIELLTRSFVRACGSDRERARAGIVDLAVMIDTEIQELLGEVAQELALGIFIGGGGFLAERGVAEGREVYFGALPEILRKTQVLNVDITVGSTHSGIHLDAVRTASGIIRQVAESDISFTRQHVPDPRDPKTWRWPTPSAKQQYETAKQSIHSAHPGALALPFWSNMARVAVFVNAPQENPFMAGGFAGPSTPEHTLSVGVNGAGVMAAAILAADGTDMADVVQSLKRYTGIMYRVAQEVRRRTLELLAQKGIEIDESEGVVDLSIAATNDRGEDGKPTNSVASALSALGVEAGAHGTLAGVGLLIDTIKKAGNGVVTYAGGLSGTFIPVSEDAGMADAVARGTLNYPRYLSMTSVCSVGVDMVPIWWDQQAVSNERFEAGMSGMLLDEGAIGVYTNKATSVRLLPVHYRPEAGLWVVVMGGGGLLGNSPILDVGLATLPAPERLVSKVGALPAPLTSFRN